MTCPRCGAPFTRLIKAEKVNEAVNTFDKRELTFQAQYENPVTWQGDRYLCSDCGLDFSPKEHTLQTVRGVADV